MKKFHLIYVVLLFSAAIASLTGCGDEAEEGNPEMAFGITNIYPSRGMNNVSTTAIVSVTFNQSVNPPSNNNISFSPAVDGEVSYDPDTFTMQFRPLTPMRDYTSYSMTIDGVTSLSGKKTQAITLTFETSVADEISPEIEYSYPENGQTGVGLDDNIKIRFSEPIDKTKFRSALSVYPDINLDIGKWLIKWSGLDEREATILPSPGQKTFDANKEYILRLSRDKINDRSGNSLVKDFAVKFKTLRYPPEKLSQEDVTYDSMFAMPKEPPFMFMVGRFSGTKKWVIGWGGSAPKGITAVPCSGSITASGDGEIMKDSIDQLVGHGGDKISFNLSSGKGNTLTFSSEAIGQGILEKWFKLLFECDASYLTFNLSMQTPQYISIGSKGIHPTRSPFVLRCE